jgi:hypothetical protein
MEDVGAVAARGAGETACGAGEEVVGGASGAQVEALEDGPAGKNLCGDPIGASTVSDASKNSNGSIAFTWMMTSTG